MEEYPIFIQGKDGDIAIKLAQLLHQYNMAPNDNSAKMNLVSFLAMVIAVRCINNKMRA